MANTVRLTVAQALVKFLNNQYIEFDGKQNKMFKGIFTIFGHGNVVGLGEALENDPGDLPVNVMNKVWLMQQWVMQNKKEENKFMHVLLL